MSRIRKSRETANAPRVAEPEAPTGGGVEIRRDTGFWRRHGWGVLSLWAVVLAAYSNSFQAGLVFDNSPAILKDSRVHQATAKNLGLILHAEYWYNASTTGLYRPLTTFSYLVNHAVLGNGPNPAHAANILLVYLLGLLVFEDAALGWAPNR